MASAKSTAICFFFVFFFFFLTMMGLLLLEKMKMKIGLCCGVSNSIPSVHVVGDSKRWTSLGHVDYTDWASTKNFHVDDALRRLLVPLLFFFLLVYRLYTYQTASNITRNIALSGEFYDTKYSHGGYLRHLAIQYVIKTAVTSYPICAYPFAWPKNLGKPPPSTNRGNNIMHAPKKDVGANGVISVITHELAEVSSNPLVNAWYAGDDPTAPTEIADLCDGVYGSGGGGGYVGKVFTDSWGHGYNVNGVKGRRFLVQWVWNPLQRRCFGPDAVD
ncbi:hypothetical protein SO802_033719 [Lithocarpus litseifolius]|uniref:Uncharacterized protein n=1 Tax=Lithocarpus litseifolius TaxID=425828 RepID=A0AAW2BGR6_9ROSI